MQVKTIEKTINKKITEWLETISDLNLRELVKNDIIVTGGCIASMLLKEPVNDYDIYFKTNDVVVKLVKYYINKHDVTDVNIIDGSKINRNAIAVDGFRQENDSYAIAYRNTKPDQVNLYLGGNGGITITKRLTDVEKNNPDRIKYKLAFVSPNAISLTDDIQLITRFIGDPSHIHSNYDFVHATNYYTFEDGIVLNKEALTSLLTKQLSYIGSLYPVTSVIRMRKFINRGWRINAGDILKIVFQCSELDLNDVNVLEQQLIGVDVAYFELLITLLRESKKDHITFEFLNTMIDKVFNISSDD